MADAIASEGRLKDRYRLERTLGHGGMAVVWLGHDEVLERPVAVKVLSDTIASDPGFVARFRREARTMAGLSHPNLVGVYDFSEEGERPIGWGAPSDAARSIRSFSILAPAPRRSNLGSCRIASMPPNWPLGPSARNAGGDSSVQARAGESKPPLRGCWA